MLLIWSHFFTKQISALKMALCFRTYNICICICCFCGTSFVNLFSKTNSAKDSTQIGPYYLVRLKTRVFWVSLLYPYPKYIQFYLHPHPIAYSPASCIISAHQNKIQKAFTIVTINGFKIESHVTIIGKKLSL